MTDKYDQFLDAPDKFDAFLDAPEEEWKGSTNVPKAEEPKQAPKRSITEELARQVGLTGRAAVTGVLSPFTTVAEIVPTAYNVGANLMGSPDRIPSVASSQEKLLTRMGFPVPENAVERASQVGAQAMAGQAGLTKAAQVIGATASPLLVNPTQQVVAAGAAGAASQPTAEYVQKVTGSPIAAVAASLAVGSLAGKVAGKTADKIAGGQTPPVTIEDIKQRAQRAYTQMEQLDVNARPLSVQNMLNSTENALNRANFNPQMDSHRPVAQLLDQFRQMTGTARVPFTRLEQMRSAAVSMSRESNDAATRRLAGIVVGEIDDYMTNMGPRDLMPGTQRGADAVRAVKSARNDWKLQARAQVIEDILDTAKLRAENPRASEADLIRQGLTSLAANKNKMRMFDSDEQNAIKEAVKSKSPDFLLNILAKFNPERPVVMNTYALVGGVGSTATGNLIPAAGAVGLATTGFGADKLYGALKRRDATKLASDILTGTVANPRPDYRLPGLFGATQVKPEGNW